jgi:REP element-mobilizing transposase RayT
VGRRETWLRTEASGSACSRDARCETRTGRASSAARHDPSPRGLAPSLRRELARGAITSVFRAGRDRFGFRLTEHSLQSNHIHLIAEADDRSALSRGMQGLLVRIARALNRLWKRRGSVFADRFHVRALRTPREVRAALVYVLQNARRHGLRLLGIDPYSSGPWFEGWKQRGGGARGHSAVREPPGVRAKTWLLLEGWRRHGPIGIEECPRAPS